MQKIKLVIMILIIVILGVTIIKLKYSTQNQDISENKLIIKNLPQYNIEAECSSDDECTLQYGYDGNKCNNGCPSCAKFYPEDNTTIAIRKDWKDDCPPKDSMTLCLQCIGAIDSTEFTAEAKCIQKTCQKIMTKTNKN